jgi:hypothetical protein
LRLRSGQLASVTWMRPPLRCGMPSRRRGMSTRKYCGIVGESCVTMVTLIGGPGGTSWASADMPADAVARRPANHRTNVMESSSMRPGIGAL